MKAQWSSGGMLCEKDVADRDEFMQWLKEKTTRVTGRTPDKYGWFSAMWDVPGIDGKIAGKRRARVRLIEEE